MKKAALGLALVLALGTAACSKGSDKAAKASATTSSSAPAGGTSATTTPAATGPVTDADVAGRPVNPLRKALVVVVAAAVGFAGGATGAGLRPVPAGAQQVRLDTAKRLATAAITRRVLALRELMTAAKSIVRLSDADRSALTTQLQDQVNGLTSLNAKIQGDNDEATVRADAQKIITDYRVYVLTIPKARGVVVADIELNAEDRLSKLADRLQSMIDQASGKDTTKAKSYLASLRAKLTSVTGTVSPLPGLRYQLIGTSSLE